MQIHIYTFNIIYIYIYILLLLLPIDCPLVFMLTVVMAGAECCMSVDLSSLRYIQVACKLIR